jgi:hypothetical protein
MKRALQALAIAIPCTFAFIGGSAVVATISGLTSISIAPVSRPLLVIQYR